MNNQRELIARKREMACQNKAVDVGEVDDTEIGSVELVLGESVLKKKQGT